MPDHPLKSFLVELLPGLLGAAVGYFIGAALSNSTPIAQATTLTPALPSIGALTGFLVGHACVALMHWGSRLGAKTPPPPPLDVPTVPDETVWPPPPQVR